MEAVAPTALINLLAVALMDGRAMSAKLTLMSVNRVLAPITAANVSMKLAPIRASALLGTKALTVKTI
jgi:hypothetical protein